MTAPAATLPELAEQLGDLGLGPGRLVMVHASMRALGPIVGGATGLIEALEQAVSPGGTLFMMVSSADAPRFDPLVTPADPENGVLAEVFRTHPGVEVNAHPACRFAALGPLAATLLEPQPWHDYYGPGSPLERFVANDGAVLRLGADVDTVTLTHYAEYLAVIAGKRRVTRRYVLSGSTPVPVESLDDSSGIAVWSEGDYFPRILLDFLAAGRAKVGPVGSCTAELLDGREFLDFAVAWLERVFG